MAVYFKIIQYNFLRFLTYPWEIFAVVLNRILEVVSMVALWTLILHKSSISSAIHELVSYFLIAGGISGIMMAERFDLARFVKGLIKNGELSNFLIKPVAVIPFLFSTQTGKNGANIAIGIIGIIIGLIIHPPATIYNVVYFAISLIISFSISFGFNLLLSAISLVFTELGGMLNSLMHITRIFSGLLIPLTYFPQNIRAMVQYLPFPFMVFGPTQALQQENITSQYIVILGVGVLWGIFMNCLAFFTWFKAIKSYEANLI
jgi:ABC-2 type transport system permease protein